MALYFLSLLGPVPGCQRCKVYSVSSRSNDLQNSPLIMTDENLIKQLNVRLSTVERDVKTIKDAVNNVSLEEKLGRAIENIAVNI